MFCRKCGAKNEDTAAFCTNCGAKLNQSAPTRTAAAAVSIPNDKNRKIGMIAVAAAVVIVVILGVFLFGGRSPKATIDQCIEATYSADVEALLLDLVPEGVWEYAMEEEGYDSDDLEAKIEEAEDDLQDQLDSLDSYYGEDWEVSHAILYEGNIKGRDLEDIQEMYEDMDVKVSAAKEMEVEITVTSEETEVTQSVDISLIKVGRSWYLDIGSMGSLF